MAEEKKFGTVEGESYGDIPQTMGPMKFIGLAKGCQRYYVGFTANEIEVDGSKYAGHIFVGPREKGEEPKATEAHAKDVLAALGGNKKFVDNVLLITMPVASITNRSAEDKADPNKFRNQFIQSSVKTMGFDEKTNLKHEKSQVAGLHLVTLPSLMDAWARWNGVYTKPIFDPQALAGIGGTADATFTFDTLTLWRKEIWAALGEPDWMKTYNSSKAENLRKALWEIYMNPWQMWAEYMSVNDPSPKAFYPGKSKDDPDKMVDKRHWIPVITRFFDNEHQAVEAGKADLNESDNGGAKAPGQAEYMTVFPKLSKGALELYSATDWPATAASIRDDVLAAKGLKPKLNKIKSDYGISQEDLDLVVGLK